MKKVYSYRCPGLWFICAGRWILHAKDTSRHPLLLSERYGYGPRALTVFNWRITFSVRKS